jgi:hypothetical protein
VWNYATFRFVIAPIYRSLTKTGLFGAGTYFAEHPCKIDQYTTADSVWRGGKKHFVKLDIHTNHAIDLLIRTIQSILVLNSNLQNVLNGPFKLTNFYILFRYQRGRAQGSP